jgi:Abnormal spindle-like microcephaly-assoc'd, ASPM-SPD-2-Hydin
MGNLLVEVKNRVLQTSSSIIAIRIPLSFNSARRYLRNTSSSNSCPGFAGGRVFSCRNVLLLLMILGVLMGLPLMAHAGGQLTASTSTLSFGDVAVKTTAAQSIILTSTGTQAVTITSVAVSGSAFSASGVSVPVTLNPGATLALNISFHPTSKGAKSGRITILDSGSTGGKITVNLSGNATFPQLTLSAGTLAFGNVVLKTASTQKLTVQSSGTAPVTINSVALGGASFTISGPAFPVTMNPGQFITLQVSFNPTVVGAASGTIHIYSNSYASGTISVSLSGTGTAAAVPQLTVSTGSLAFGNIVVNTTSTQALTLTSSGTSAVTVNSVTVAGGGFAVSGASFPATLNPGQSVTIQVSFDPTVAGAASGTITVSSNSSSSSTTTVALSGTGTSPQLTVSASTLAFGNVAVNSTSSQTLTLTSSGTAAVTVNSATLSGSEYTMSGATFPVTLNPNIAITVQVQFDPTTVGAASGALTVSSNSTTGSKSTVSLSGNGTAAQHQVSLSWVAPANSPVPVADYNIYRATGSSSSYQLLNSSNSTSFVDFSVQANTAYTYYVTSVSGSGTESSPSNQVNVTTPQ